MKNMHRSHKDRISEDSFRLLELQETIMSHRMFQHSFDFLSKKIAELHSRYFFNSSIDRYRIIHS